MTLVAGLALALALAACGEAIEPGSDVAGENGAGEQHDSDGSETPPPEAPEEMEDPDADFDRDEARERAEGYLGVAEDDIEAGEMVRIIRRGDEDYMVTMDLRPGRMNLELDDDGSGTHVVTRVTVETPDGDDLVVE